MKITAQQNFPFSVLNVKLKSGFLVGFVGVSAATGTFTFVQNFPEISKNVKEACTPVFEFFNPYLTQIQTGSKNIVNSAHNWLGIAGNKSLNFISGLGESTEIKKIISGGQIIQTQSVQQLKSLYSLLKSLVQLIQTYFGDVQKARESFAKLYMTVQAISKFLDSITSMIEQFIEKLNDNKEVLSESSILKSLMSIATKEDGMSTLGNMLKTFGDNSSVLSSAKPSTLSSLFSMAAANPSEFNTKVEELSKNSSSNGGNPTSGTWGNYGNEDKLVEAFGLKEQKAKTDLAAKILSVTVCSGGDGKCDDDDVEKILETFFDQIKKKIEELQKNNANAKSIAEKMTLQEYLKEDNNQTKQIINQLFTSVEKKKEK